MTIVVTLVTSKRKSDVFMKQTKWLGNEIYQNGIKPNEEKLEAILRLTLRTT